MDVQNNKLSVNNYGTLDFVTFLFYLSIYVLFFFFEWKRMLFIFSQRNTAPFVLHCVVQTKRIFPNVFVQGIVQEKISIAWLSHWNSSLKALSADPSPPGATLSPSLSTPAFDCVFLPFYLDQLILLPFSLRDAPRWKSLWVQRSSRNWGVRVKMNISNDLAVYHINVLSAELECWVRVKDLALR